MDVKAEDFKNAAEQRDALLKAVYALRAASGGSFAHWHGKYEHAISEINKAIQLCEGRYES